MLRVDRSVILAIGFAALTLGAAEPEAPRLEIFPSKGSWAISTGPSRCMGLDGLTVPCRAASKRGIGLSICADSLAGSFEMPVDEAVSEGDTVVHGPFSPKGFSEAAPYSSYADLQVFGEGAASRWFRLGTRVGDAYVPPWGLEFCGDRNELTKRVRFAKPTILRAPFLSLLRIPVGVADTATDDRNYGERDDGTFVRGAARADGPATTAWLAVHDIAGRGRFVMEGARAPGNKVAWRFSDGVRVQRRILLEGIHFPQPRRIETFAGAPGALPAWIVEADENFGDGVRTRLWIVRPDTLLYERIGLRDADGESKESWSVDRSKERVRIQAKGEKPRFVSLKPRTN